MSASSTPSIKLSTKNLRCFSKDDSVDAVSKKVIAIANSASSIMLDKADECDISGFQAFTIRNLDKLLTESDIKQYKLLSVREDPIDNRQQYLDVVLSHIVSHWEIWKILST